MLALTACECQGNRRRDAIGTSDATAEIVWWKRPEPRVEARAAERTNDSETGWTELSVRRIHRSKDPGNHPTTSCGKIFSGGIFTGVSGPLGPW